MALGSCLKPPRSRARVSFSLLSCKAKKINLPSRQNCSGPAWNQGSECASKYVVGLTSSSGDCLVLRMQQRNFSSFDDGESSRYVKESQYGGSSRARDVAPRDGRACKAASAIQRRGLKFPPHTVK
ncbi:hypothetical protein SUGI_1037660 [Cryptomeria japonica]|nr:hypothetical protein SUGI_1037660 [Cryptomeria japonica]